MNPVDAIAQALKNGVNPEDIRRAIDGNPELLQILQAQVDRVRLESIGEGNPIVQIARSRGHVLIVAKTGAGKTSFMTGVIADACLYFPGCHWSIVTPKDDAFWDWGTYPNQQVLTQLPLHLEGWVDLLFDRVERMWNLFCYRNSTSQACVKKGQPRPTFPPAFLFLDEWFSLWDELKALPPIEYEDESGKVKTKKDLRGDQIVRWLRKIVAMGRALNCFLYLVGQSSNTTEIGFSAQARGNFSVVALGRSGHQNEVGFDSITRVLNDSWLFPNRERALMLRRNLPSVIKQAKLLGDAPVVLINSGEGKLWIIPDISPIAQAKISLPNAV